jgi:outer membrane immunogenic protein
MKQREGSMEIRCGPIVKMMGAPMLRLLASAAAVAMLSTAVYAADLPLPDEPIPEAVVSPAFSWTGPYIGVFAGFAFMDDIDLIDVNGYNGGGGAGDFSYDPDGGFIGGGTGGYNLQWGMAVLGVEANAAWLNIDDDAQFPPFVGVRTGADSVAAIETDFYGDITGRLGVAFNRFLAYGRGGAAFTHAEVSFTDTDPVGLTLVSGTSADDWLFGWTVGGGLEFAVTNNWTVRGEYMFTQFDETISHTATNSAGGTNTFDHEIDDLQIVKFGAAYKF